MMPTPTVLSQRAQALKPSLTLEIGARAKALRNEGRDICSLSAGEPDFDPPAFIVAAARKALGDGITRYGPAAGDPAVVRRLPVPPQRSTVVKQLRGAANGHTQIDSERPSLLPGKPSYAAKSPNACP